MSRAGWETRWREAWEQGRAESLGPKGQEYARQLDRSEAAHRGWETRWREAWERGAERDLGPKGQQFVRREFGIDVPAEPIRRAPPGEEIDMYDDLFDPYDIQDSYTGD